MQNCEKVEIGGGGSEINANNQIVQLWDVRGPRISDFPLNQMTNKTKVKSV